MKSDGWNSKNRDIPKWNVENNGKPYFLMDDLGGKPPYFRKHPDEVSLVIGYE